MNQWLASRLLYHPVTFLAGERVLHYLKEYQARDKAAQSELARQQSAQLQKITKFAQKRTRFYSDAFEARDGPPSAYPQLSGLPLLQKTDIRDSPELFRTGGWQLFHEKKTTSGSTGHPVTIFKNRGALARERAATWRAYAWAGIDVAAPQALMWGIPHSRSGRMKAFIKDFIANRKRLAVFGTSNLDFARFHTSIIGFRPQYLYGYVSSIASFAEYISANGLTLPDSIKAIITTAELLDSRARDVIEGSTGIPVFNEYGCGEVGSIAHECERHKMHIMSDNVVLESIPNSELPDGLGELVVTDLHNRAMPLIRYRLGDLGVVSTESCDCGLPYPVLERIVGRAYDIIYDNIGNSYHPESVLYIFEDLRQSGVNLPAYQAIQSEDGHLKLLFQSPDGLSRDIETAIRSRFAAAFDSQMQISIGSFEKPAREASGKLRIVRREVRDD